MKVINLPTFAEYISSYNGCGLNYTNYFNRLGGRYKQNLECLYFSHCALLDNYSQSYLLDCNYFDIEIATEKITQHARKRQQQIKRTKYKK